mmetsp:Transcript_29070/g.41636  ORF Transcript_29070/g.41636 Transcript_29070/m.41636 type:complete len:85 (+) Transcript_29070:128-382(+)
MTTSKTNTNNDEQNKTPMLTYCFAGIILATAAGLTMYTKRTGQLFSQIERINANAAARKPKPKPGPLTREEWDKVRNRWEKDDI